MDTGLTVDMVQIRIDAFRQWYDQEAPIELLSSTEIGPMIGSSFIRAVL